VVGTRRATAYGRMAAQEFSRGLAVNGITVVSGLARGVDTVAHRASLDAGGRTVAVLANGLDTVYPSENRRLAEEIAERGGPDQRLPAQDEAASGFLPSPEPHPLWCHPRQAGRRGRPRLGRDDHRQICHGVEPGGLCRPGLDLLDPVEGALQPVQGRGGSRRQCRGNSRGAESERGRASADFGRASPPESEDSASSWPR